MKKILINGLNAKAGGGKSILNNYLKILSQKNLSYHYYVLTPNRSEYLTYKNDKIHLININRIYSKHFFLPYTYTFKINKLIKELSIETVFNLADIPIRTATHQVFLFDWAYAVYPESIIWRNMTLKDSITRQLKLFFFKKYSKHIDLLIAQNVAMKERLNLLFKIKNIQVINNAVSLENLDSDHFHDFKLPPGIKLVYLTHYYPHKNIEIFIPLSLEIKRRKLDYKIITTIEEGQGKGAAKFLREIKKLNLQNVIINVGSVPMKNVPSLYQQTDGLLMPTLLESFSGTYVEAMYHQIPILTSKFDFAEVVCEDAAIYFDPLNFEDILEKIEFTFNQKERIWNLKKAATLRLSNLSSWEAAFEQYQNLILNETKPGINDRSEI